MGAGTVVLVASVLVGQALRWAGKTDPAGTVETVGGLAERLWPGANKVRTVEKRLRAQLEAHRPDLESVDGENACGAVAELLRQHTVDPLEVVADLDAVARRLRRDAAGIRSALEPRAQRWFDQILDASLHVLKDEALSSPGFVQEAHTRQLRDHSELREAHDALAHEIEELPGRVWRSPAVPQALRYLTEVVEPLAISDPNRDAERALVGDFVRQNDDAWWWWTAEPWAGKTTFMADLAIRPPEGAEIAVFLTIGRDPTADDREDFFDHIGAQLAVLAGEDSVERASGLTPVQRSQEFHALLAKAGDSCRRRGTQLLLLVDGLDEDARVGGSIASALPERPPAGVKVMVASRTMPAMDARDGCPRWPPFGDAPPRPITHYCAASERAQKPSAGRTGPTVDGRGRFCGQTSAVRGRGSRKPAHG